jgi:hypothetical protein
LPGGQLLRLHVTEPGLYFAVVSRHTVQDYADPLGDNRWPVSACRDVLVDCQDENQRCER